MLGVVHSYGEYLHLLLSQSFLPYKNTKNNANRAFKGEKVKGWKGEKMTFKGEKVKRWKGEKMTFKGEKVKGWKGEKMTFKGEKAKRWKGEKVKRWKDDF